MAIEDRNLKVGTVLKASYKGKEYECHVTDRGDGNVGYTLMNNGLPTADFKSPSAAGSAVMGGVACNGWRFWSVDGVGAAKAPSKAKAKAKAKPKAKAKAKGKKEDAVEKPVACGNCGAEFPSAAEVVEHMVEAHGAPEAAGNGGR